MLNNVILVGRLINEIELRKPENKVCDITIAVPRPYKNENGEYETDNIPCVIWGAAAMQAKEYCKVGDLIGIKGRVKQEGEKIVINADRITYIGSNKNEEEEQDGDQK